MTHGDDSGLVLPPAVAPIQVVIIPVQMHKPGVLEAAEELRAKLAPICRVKVDASDNTPGWKFSEYEMKGVPLRIEIGPRDIEAGQCVVVRRDNRQKMFVKLEGLATVIPETLTAFTKDLFQKALQHREERTWEAFDLDTLTEIASTKSGYIKAMWCGELACEEQLKETADVTSRCIPFGMAPIGDRCVCCGKPATKLVYWGKAY